MSIPDHPNGSAPWRQRQGELAFRVRAARAVRLGLPVLVIAFLIAATTALLVTSVTPATYAADVVLRVGQPSDVVVQDRTGLLISQRLAPTFARLSTSQIVLRGAAERLGTSASALAGRVAARVDGESRLVITGRAATAVGAADLANAVALEIVSDEDILGAQAFPFEAARQEVEAVLTRIAAVGRQIDAVAEQIQESGSTLADFAMNGQRTARRVALQVELATLFDRFQTYRRVLSRERAGVPAIIQAATPPGSPELPRPAVNAILAGILGVVLVLPLVASILIGAPVRTADEVRKWAGLSMLGEVGHRRSHRTAGRTHPLDRIVSTEAALQEDYRSLRWALGLALRDERTRTLHIVGADRREGQLVVAANLAILFAEGGRHTLLVDTDREEPILRSLLSAQSSQRAVGVPAGSGIVPGSAAWHTRFAGLDLLATGPQSFGSFAVPSAGAHAVVHGLEDLEDRYDLVIVSWPSLRSLGSALRPDAALGPAIVVFDAGVTTRAASGDVYRLGSQSGITFVGAVLVHLPRDAYAVQRGTTSVGSTQQRAPAASLGR